MSNFTVYGGQEIHNCTVCDGSTTLWSIPLGPSEHPINKEEGGMIYQVACTKPYPQCCCTGPLRTNPNDAVEGWHNLIGKHADGSEKDRGY